jgi:hypothetical protein
MFASTNPFLQLLAAVDGDGAPPGEQNLADLQLQETTKPVNVKLPDFWPQAPSLWFARAECRFEMMAVTSERQKFCCVADALNYESMWLVADLIASPPAENPYAALKERLMMAHQLSAVQRVEKLLQMPALGARRPSDMLAAMFEHCPAGEERSIFFRALFLNRLPSELRVLLTGEETAELKELATRADQLWLKFEQRKEILAPVQGGQEQGAEEQEEQLVAALPPKKKFQRKKRGGGGGPQAASGQPGGQQSSGKGKKVFLCWTHLKFGSSAWHCADPESCGWPEN